MGSSRQKYWNVLPFPPSRESSQPRDQTPVSCIANVFFTTEPMKMGPLSWGRKRRNARGAGVPEIIIFPNSLLATWREELTHWKRPWCWERLKAGGEGDDRGWDGWMASPTGWTWDWVSSRSWWWTGRPGVLQSMRSQRVGKDWATELKWTLSWVYCFLALSGASIQRVKVVELF